MSKDEQGDEVSLFVGGASGPMKNGMRLHASWPLVVLSIRRGRLTFSGRGPLRRRFRETDVDPHLASAEGVRGLLMNGIVITTGADRWLFLTPKQKQALVKLEEAGVRIIDGNRRVLWKDYMGY